MVGQVVSVGLLTAYIRELLERDELLADIWIEGEISDLFQSRAGHVYFTLKDAESQLRGVLFQGLASRQRYTMRSGDQVAAHGRISVYQRSGQYQLYADAVQPAGIGLLALQLELLRQQLDAEGLFDPSRKRPVPAIPRYIGVVTSPDGAVWHDIQHVLARRFPIVELILSPATVQGERAPASIVAALEALQADGRAEVIILARGGGSAEDLWCFNDERVARAVFACRVPVVSGIGHETDWTLVDDVADLRAPTPSAAAELCSPSIFEFVGRLQELTERLQIVGAEAIEHRRSEADRLSRSINQAAPRLALVAAQTSTSTLRRSLSLAVRARIAEERSNLLIRADRAMRHQIESFASLRLANKVAEAKLSSMNPQAVLDRGYAVLTVVDGDQTIHSIADVSDGLFIEAHVSDGSFRSTVVPTKSHEETRTTQRG
ncbi:MAG: exodeoxyribonuclease VII large subunit [Thermomicrobiales bacterium]